MPKRFKTVGWYTPGYVPGYAKARTEEEALATTTLIAFNDVGPETYIPVFNSQHECDKFVRGIAEAHGDLAFTICKYDNLAEIYQQVKEEFKDQHIKLIIKESNDNEM